MKTIPMKHQEVGLQLLTEHPEFMLACEQGTGKTWMLLADAERRFEAGEIDALLVIAPSGVQTNWVKIEIPKHLSVPYRADYFVPPTSKVRERRMAKLLEAQDDRSLCILTINIEAVNTNDGFRMCMQMLRHWRTVMVIDESHRIKSPTASCTKQTMRMSEFAAVRRCATGTPIANKPIDAFAQFEFLGSGLLGTTSYRAFVAKYTQLLPPSSRFVMDIVARKQPRLIERYRAEAAKGNDNEARRIMEQIARLAPQLPCKDANGRPIYRNLDELRTRMAPHMYRVTKEDCLDLPEKIYQTRTFELGSEQRKLYNFIDENSRFEDEDDNISAFNVLTKLGKLQQATSGFLMINGEKTELNVENPRLDALIDALEEVEGQFIVWAAFKEEIRAISQRLGAAGISHVTYYGDVKKADRIDAIDAFQNGAARAFVGTAAAGGTGLTLTAATTVFYYSNTLKLTDRLQSEDRCHRIGTTQHVLYIDLVAVNTRDEEIAAALQFKQDVAAYIIERRQ